MPAIKIAGRSTGTSKTSRTNKPAAKRNTTRKTASTSKSSGNGRRKSTSGGGTVMSDGRVRREVTDDQKVITKYAKLLKKAGDKRDSLYHEHKEAVQEVYEVSREAMEAGVPTGVIADNASISRQWLYKMGEHADRGETGNGGSAPKAKRGPGRPRKNTTEPRKGGSKKLTIRR